MLIFKEKSHMVVEIKMVNECKWHDLWQMLSDLEIITIDDNMMI